MQLLYVPILEMAVSTHTALGEIVKIEQMDKEDFVKYFLSYRDLERGKLLERNRTSRHNYKKTIRTMMKDELL